MSAIVRARLKTQALDGIDVWDGEVGKEYHVDLESRMRLEWHNAELGRQRDLDCVWDVEAGGFIPVEVLELFTS